MLLSQLLPVIKCSIMCYSPIYIDNPNYKNPSKLAQRIYDTESTSIPVPCGKCAACRSKKQSDILQRVQMMIYDYYVYYFTLTYKNEAVPFYTLANGKVLMCPRFEDVTLMFKRLRKNAVFGDRSIKYLVTSEYTPKHARPHYHGLLFIHKKDSDSRFEYANLEGLAFKSVLHEWRRNIATRVALKDTKKYRKGEIVSDTRRPVYLPLCDYKTSFRNGKLHSTYDLHYVQPTLNGDNDVSYYVTKYLFKDCKAVKYIQACCYHSYDAVQAREVFKRHFKNGNRRSVNFGMLYDEDKYALYRSTHDRQYKVHSKRWLDKITADLNFALHNDGVPTFYDIYTGKALPMCGYYKQHCPKELIVPLLEESKRRRLCKRSDFKLIHDESIHQMNMIAKSDKVIAKAFVSDVFDDEFLFLEDDLPSPHYVSPIHALHDSFDQPINSAQDDIVSSSDFDFCDDLPELIIKTPLHIQLQIFN